MAPAQIAKLHFHADEGHRKTLLALLCKKADSGGLDFDDIAETCSWAGSSVSVGITAQPSLAATAIRNMYRETRDQQLSDAHRRTCGWAKLLRGVTPGQSVKLADHACDCEVLCMVEKVYHNGLPKRWRLEGRHPDGLKIDASCTALPLITAKQYLDFCADNGIPTIPVSSPLSGWANETVISENAQPPSEEEMDRLNVQAIAGQWLEQFPLKQYPLLTTRAAKKHPKLSSYYENTQAMIP